MDVTTTAVEIPLPESRPALPNPQPIETQTFKWQVFVLTSGEESGTQVIRGPKKLDGAQAYYAITPKDYEVLARNMAEMLRYVKEAYWRLQYYRGEGELDGDAVP